MTQAMLERAARAVGEVVGYRGDDILEKDSLAFDIARAVLLAVRGGITGEDFLIMERAKDKWPSSQCDNARELAISRNEPKWTAMIDAILNERPR